MTIAQRIEELKSEGQQLTESAMPHQNALGQIQARILEINGALTELRKFVEPEPVAEPEPIESE